MTSDLFDNAKTPIPRDRHMRPMIIPPGGGRPVPYTRCTTYVGALEDTYNLEKWKMRMVAIGLVDREDLHLAVAAHRDDKDHLNKICDQAVEAAKASAGATRGTALHALVDQWDRGTLDLTKVPAGYRDDIQAYARATEHLRVRQIEQFGVHDDIKVAGTWDRIYELPDGRAVIGDTKTGSIEWGMGKIAMQLAMYSRATPYDHETAPGSERGTSNCGTVDQTTAIVVHLPAGAGTCELVEVNIAAGWEAVSLAGQVRVWRARKDLGKPYSSASVSNREASLLADLICTATAVEHLHALWTAHRSHWTDEHSELARARKNVLQATG